MNLKDELLSMADDAQALQRAVVALQGRIERALSIAGLVEAEADRAGLDGPLGLGPTKPRATRRGRK